MILDKEKDLVEMAKSSKKLPNFVWAIILVLIFLFVGQVIGGIFSILIYIILSKSSYLSSNQDLLVLFINLFSFLFISLLVIFRVKFIEKRSVSTLGFCKECWLKKYAKGFLIGMTMMSIVVLILFMFGCISIEKNTSQPTGMSALGGVGFILIGWIIQGATEEIVTRGWLMNVIGAKYNISFGLILSSTLFGFLHLLNPEVNYLAVINIILVGLFFGIYAIKTRNLWSVCGIHTAWNFAQGNIFGFEVSGMNVEVSSIFDFNLVGNNVISGGEFGPEAGLISTFVLLASIVIILFLDKKGHFVNI